LEKTGDIGRRAGPDHQEAPDSTAADRKWRELAQKVQNVVTDNRAGGGVRQPAADINSAELAAYAAVCSLILNLDESISVS
jgi:hypothetical protein